MTTSSSSVLAVAAANLARANAADWEQFLAAFAAFSEVKTNECIGSTTEQLPVCQGRAQICRELRKLFAECKTTADAISKNKQQPRSLRPATGASW